MVVKTYAVKARDIVQDWHVLNAEGQTLGRLASQVAGILRGKHKPSFSPHLDMGDFVVVVNAAKVRVSGRKREQKQYYRHSGYIGGLKVERLETLMARRPERVIELAVRGMLPHNRLGRKLIRHLKVYAGPKHPHEAQIRATEKRRAMADSSRAGAGEGTPAATQQAGEQAKAQPSPASDDTPADEAAQE